MSDIFVPTLGLLSPKYIDGVDNVVTRAAGGSTNSLAFASVAQIDLLPNTFGNDRNNNRIILEFAGQTVGIAGVKQFRTQIDGVTVYTPASANTTTNPGTFRVQLYIIFRNGQFIAYMRTIMGDGVTGALNINSIGNNAGAFAAFDPTISHTVVLQALVANAADTVRCDWIGAAIR